MGIEEFFSEIHNVLIAKYGKERLREISRQQIDETNQAMTEWAHANALKNLPGATENQRLQVLEAIIAACRTGMRSSDIALVVKKLLKTDIHTAEMIATTEATRLAGFCTYFDIKRAGFKYKKWLTCGDNFVRHSHAAIGDRIVGIDEPFVTPEGAAALFPGGFEDHKENEGCRCAINAVIGEETDPVTGEIFSG